MQSRGQVVLQRLADRAQSQDVGQFVAVDANRTAQCRHVFGRGGAPNRRRVQFHLDRGSADRQCSLLNLGDAGGVRQNQFDAARRRHPDVPGLRVQRTAVVAGVRPLAVGKERLAGVAEGDFLDIAERLNGRVLAGALACPGAQQGGEDSDAGMELGHVRQGTASRTPPRERRVPGHANALPSLCLELMLRCQHMRTTIRIDDELYREVKAKAARSGRTVAAVLEDAVRRGLNPTEEPTRRLYAVKPTGRGGLRSGVDLSSNAALAEVMDEGASVDDLR